MASYIYVMSLGSKTRDSSHFAKLATPMYAQVAAIQTKQSKYKQRAKKKKEKK